MAKSPKQEVRTIEDILANKVDRTALMGFLDESVRCRQLIADQQESLRAIRSEAMEKIGIQPKIFNSLVRIAYDNNHLEKQHEIHALDSAIEILFDAGE